MKELLQKVLQVIKNNPEVRKHFVHEGQKIGVMNWHNSAGNHLFDDHPEWFNINENEGHQIRSYFQTNSYRDADHIKELQDWGLLE
jgi:hypothetical protein